MLRELAGAEYEGLTQQELELALTQHRQQAEREKFQKLQADALLSGIAISQERQAELLASLQRRLDRIGEEVRKELAASSRAGGLREDLKAEADRRIADIRAEAETEARKKKDEVRQSFQPKAGQAALQKSGGRGKAPRRRVPTKWTESSRKAWRSRPRSSKCTSAASRPWTG